MAGYYADIRVTYDKVEMENNIARSKKKKKDKAISRAISIANLSNTTSSYLISKVGDYTGNRHIKHNVATMAKYSGYAISAISSPYVALASVAVDTANNVTDYVIRTVNSEQQTDYKRSLLGNMASSNSRWRGDYK